MNVLRCLDQIRLEEEFTVLLAFSLHILSPPSLSLSFMEACITALFGACTGGQKGLTNIQAIRAKSGGFVSLSE